MRNIKSLFKKSLLQLKSFPSCIPPNTYGTTVFWVEEYWAFVKVKLLLTKYPNLNFSGLFNSLFINTLPSILIETPHQKVKEIKEYHDINSIIWEMNNEFMNIATSHAPSRFIARNYLTTDRENFRIINFDAHLDISDSSFIHGAWISNDLTARTALIGGWAEQVSDLNNARSNLAFLAPDISSLSSNNKFISWLHKKQVYITIDLDYFGLSQKNYMGYANFWHRDKIIGHSMNLDQILEERADLFHKNPFFVLQILMEHTSDINLFFKKKKESLKLQTKIISNLLNEITNLLQATSSSLLRIDFVEYSPICDWKQLTIKEFINNYLKFHNILLPIAK